jgi:Lrp/AsnC family transcriptional regulator, leucine-responsive regulatory protein
MESQQLDRFDRIMLAELSKNARITATNLSARVGLSSTAVARRQRLLEQAGLILGYHAALDHAGFGFTTTVLVRVTLESQSEGALRAFESQVVNCPSVMRCFLMSGSDDYLIIVAARSIEDFERIHRSELSKLPKVARIQSSFAIREIVNRANPLALFGKLTVNRSLDRSTSA